MPKEETREDEVLEEEGEEEISPFLSILEDDEEVDDDESDESDEEEEEEAEGDDASPEVLKERLKQRNLTLSKRQKAIKRMQKEIDELKKSSQMTPEVIAQLMGRSGGGRSDDDGGIDMDKLKERIEEDPSSMVEIMVDMLTNTENKVAAVLERRDKALLSKAKITREPVLQKTMEALAKKDEFKRFDEDQLETVAKTMLKVGFKGRPPAGTAGRGTKKTSQKREPTTSELEKRYTEELSQMGFSD